MIFTHNHPRGWLFPEDDPRYAGSSFSPHDVRSAALAGMAEVRAVAPGYLFTIRPAEGGLWPAPDQVGRMYAQEQATYARESTIQAMGGKISPLQVVADEAHSVWSRLAPTMGLIYRREEVGE